MHMRTLAILALAVFPATTWAADPAAIRSSFDAGYDVTPYRISIVMARHQEAVFDLGGVPQPLINPTYGRAVAVDPALFETMKQSLNNILQDPDTSQYLNVNMMTNAAETVVAACGQVQVEAGISPFLTVFTNPHANAEIQSVSFSDPAWIGGACSQMGLD